MKKDMQQLIQDLSQDAKPDVPNFAPERWVQYLICVIAMYGLIAQTLLGIRTDLATQFTRPLFVAEIVLLVALVVSGAVASVLSMYPDAYQKPKWLAVPFGVFAALVALVGSQIYMPLDTRMVIPEHAMQGMECTICIASFSIIPSALIFSLIRKGANVHPFLAGALAVLTASAVGCLTLRLSEMNDSLMHLALWHYLPTLAFACVGALLGKWILKW